jgi:coproporphyrinogen III oxidase-like Fe-S oxidoreductase
MSNYLTVTMHEFICMKQTAESYKEMLDATAKDADRAYELLRRAEVEMRYAGWNRLLTDNYARKDIYDDIKEFLK